MHQRWRQECILAALDFTICEVSSKIRDVYFEFPDKEFPFLVFFLAKEKVPFTSSYYELGV